MKKNCSGNISVAITDSSDVHCFDLYLTHIFMKSIKTESCTYIHYVQADILLFICFC